MIVLANASGTIGATGLYLLFAWLLSAALGSWVSNRKGYGERVGLTFGLLLTVVGFAIVLLLPARPGSRWKLDGPLPKGLFGRHREAVAGIGPPPAAGVGPPPPSGSGSSPNGESSDQS